MSLHGLSGILFIFHGICMPFTKCLFVKICTYHRFFDLHQRDHSINVSKFLSPSQLFLSFFFGRKKIIHLVLSALCSKAQYNFPGCFCRIRLHHSKTQTNKTRSEKKEGVKKQKYLNLWYKGSSTSTEGRT